MSDDLISRQAAIEWVNSLMDVQKYYHPHSKSTRFPLEEVIDVLQQVPSAQPEIVRCKNCDYCVAEKSYGKTYYYCDAFSYHAEGDLIGVSLQVSPEHFCGWAERRTDE